jgi:hypothetical protein
MAVNLSFIGGAGWQFLDNNGNPLSGGKIFTYLAGTTTPQPTFTSRTGLVPNTNPIILDSAGRTPEQIWSTEGVLYKYVVSTSNDVTIRTWDNIGGSLVASDFAQDLANANDPTKGDAFVGFRQSNSSGNLPGSVDRTVHGKFQEFVSVKDFGAIGDGIADDHAAIRAACDTGLPVTFPKGIYNFGTYSAPQNLTLTNDNQTLFLQGSELRFVGKGVINVDASNVTIDLQGGVLSQYVGYAEVAVQTINGGNQITVVDASNLFIGQDVASSWGNTAGSGVFPLGGPTAATKRKITNIVGNVVTLDSNMTPGDVLVPQVIFGDFTFGVFLQCFQTNLVVKNGTLERMTGYYYHSPNGIDTQGIGFRGGDIYFQNINFNGNGTDQFLIKMEQKLHLNNCKAVQQWDTAKTGVYFADSGSLYIANCDMALGNFDASITMNNLWQPVTGFGQGGEIVISDSTISGKTRFIAPPSSSQGTDSLYFLEPIYQGVFNRISISNCRIAGYTRHFISSTTTTRTKSTTIESIRVDNCLINGSFGYFIHSGVGNGINCPNINVSNTSFFQNQPHVFLTVQKLSGAGGNYVPRFDNCYFNFAGAMAGFTEFQTAAFVSDSLFNMNGINYQHRRGVAELDNCVFANNPRIVVAPTFDEAFYGELSRIVIDASDFPANPGAVFTALGGTSLNGAKLASARSVNGSVFYDVYKAGTDIRVSGVFNKANGVYKLRADDYYIPRGSNIKDMFLGTIERVTFNLATTLASDAASGSTSIVVADATGVAAGDRVNILRNDVLVDTRVVDGAYVSGTTIPLTAATSGDAASGNKVNFFRVAAL